MSEPAMLDLTKRLIAIPSENPPGKRYEECARTLLEELDRLKFDDARREGACVLAANKFKLKIPTAIRLSCSSLLDGESAINLRRT